MIRSFSYSISRCSIPHDFIHHDFIHHDFIPHELYFKILSYIVPTPSAQVIKNHSIISIDLYTRITDILMKTLTETYNLEKPWCQMYIYTNLDLIYKVIKTISDEYKHDVNLILQIDEDRILEFMEQEFDIL